MLIEYESNKCFNTKQIVTIDINEPTSGCRDPDRIHCIHVVSCEECPYLFVVPYKIVITFINGVKRTIDKETKEDVDSFMSLLKFAHEMSEDDV